MTEARRRRREMERWIAWIRLGAVPFAVFQVAFSSGYPGGYQTAAWLTTAVFGAGAAVLFALTRRVLADGALGRLGLAAMAFDFAVVSTYVVVYSFERATPIRQLIFQANFVTFQIGAEVIVALIVGWLVLRMHRESALAEARAGEAEQLRDQ